MKAEPALEFSELFRTDNVDDGSELAENEFGLIPDPPHPFEKLFSGTELRKSVEDCGWDARASAALSKSSGCEPFSNPLGFSRSSIGYKLAVVRIEQEVVDGERYSTAYNAAGECVESLHITE